MLREAQRRGEPVGVASGHHHDWRAEFYEDYEDDRDEDEETERFYFSSAAGAQLVGQGGGTLTVNLLQVPASST